MSDRPRIILKTKKERSLQRFHPIVYSGAIKKIEGEPGNGDVVDLYSNKGAFLGTGHYEADSPIPVRVFSFQETPAESTLWKERLTRAWTLRKATGLLGRADTDLFRLINAEGDDMPGLIVDIYGDQAVMRFYDPGMYRLRETLAELLKNNAPIEINGVRGQWARGQGAPPIALLGETPESVDVKENGLQFRVDLKRGQKTGFFIDQRENRAWVRHLAKDREVLDIYAYSGGFSVNAAAGGAKHVRSLDSSAQALEMARTNMALNGYDQLQETIQEDAKEYLKEKNRSSDLVILDPPSFARSPKTKHQAVQGYKRINNMAMEALRPGGFLLTFSCSQIVDRRLFSDTIRAAAIETGRPIRILSQLSQPADHPVKIYHPEGSYLKGLLLEVG